MRVMPDAKKMAGMVVYVYCSQDGERKNCRGELLGPQWHHIGDLEHRSSCPHVLGVRALGDDHQPRLSPLGDSHCGECK